MTIAELREGVEQLIRRDTPKVVPVYLLDRAGSSVMPGFEAGSVICIAGEVRNHVSASELASWAEKLARCSIFLQVLSANTPELQADAHELQAKQAHLEQQSPLLEAADADWEACRAQMAKWTQQVEAEARRGCGTRRDGLQVFGGGQGWHSAKRVGDLVYMPPRDSTTQHGIGVITQVWEGVGMGGEDVPEGWEVPRRGSGLMLTGDIDVLIWDTEKLSFEQVFRHQCEGHWELLPPCCGRGVACPHLQQKHLPQWGNGEPMELSILEPIPRAFLKWYRQAAGRQRRVAVEAAFPKHLWTFEHVFGER